MSVDAETLKAGGPGSAARPLGVARRRMARRILADRLAAKLVVLGGVTIIGAILAILAVIAAEVAPLFRPAAAEFLGVYGAERAGALPGFVGVDEYREIAYRVTADGALEFVRLGPGDPLPAVPVPGLGAARVTAVSALPGARALLGTSDGRAIPLEVKFDVTFPGGARRVTPAPEFGEPATLTSAAPRPVLRLAGTGPVVIAQVGPRDLVVRRVVETQALVGAGTEQESVPPLAVEAAGDISAVGIDERGDNLFVGTSRGEVIRYEVRDLETPRRAETVTAAAPGAAISALGFLIGERTLVVGDSSGAVSTWQVVAPDAGGAPRLVRMHRFEGHERGVIAIAASRRDKGFVTTDAGGTIRLHYGTSGRTLLSLHAPAALRAAAIAPKADGVIALGGDGRIADWTVRNPHPEISLRTLFGKVWYEGYARPEYVWQSTGGTDDFEAKLSLTPLIFGTLKGTVYALLFAVPLALLAALYTSEFMHPTLKGSVKPVVEVMAALPSVVLGFLAGLWLAPFVERIVPGLVLLPLVVPPLVLAALLLWRRVPSALRGRARSGTEVFLVIPAVVLAAAAAFALGGLVEARLLHGDYRGWLLAVLGLTYDQRNSIVVGIAMGFAVIPIIFTIAEDSFANVPPHLRAGSLALGATRWQTALKIVLPTASPGIFSAVMIGFGRAIGETMIVLMATGNTPTMDWSIFNGFRALSANIAVELPEAPEGGTLFRVLFLAAFLLFCLTFVVNTAAEVVRLRLRRRYRYL